LSRSRQNIWGDPYEQNQYEQPQPLEDYPQQASTLYAYDPEEASTVQKYVEESHEAFSKFMNHNNERHSKRGDAWH
jgi:hypothetical protein